MSFIKYTEQLFSKGNLVIIGIILISIPFFGMYLSLEATYNNPSLQWLSTILAYLSIPAIILFLIVMGYYKWKYH